MPARRRTGSALVAALLLAALLTLTGTSSPAGAATGDVTTFTDDELVNLWGIAAGPDGNLWATESLEDLLVRITPDGDITTFEDPNGDLVEPFGITGGPDGNVWFTDFSADLIGRITAAGTITTFDDPLEGIQRPYDITTGPDGNLWFSNDGGPSIGRITPSGTITTFTDPGGDLENLAGISAGPDGNVWFADYGGDQLGRITPAGTITLFTDPLGNVDEPQDITAGPDGNLWFTSAGNARLGRITPGGSITTFEDPEGGITSPETITLGADGALWFTDYATDDFGRITTSGVITSFPSGVDTIGSIAAGPDDEVWFVGQSGTVNKVQVCGGGVFTDVGITHPFRADICWMGAEGISTGYAPGPTYRPSAAVTRQAMSAFLYRLRGEPPTTPPSEPTFADVPADHPFSDEIEWMAEEAISEGYPGSPKPTYRPGDPVTRQAMSAFLYRIALEPAFDLPVVQTFTDVAPTHPFFLEIEWMADAEVSTGYLPGPTYRPANVVTRQAMSAFMQRVSGVLPVT